MEKHKNGFQEQEAPQKNTDKAFVKVGEDGKPKLPEGESETTHATQTPPTDNKEKER